MFIVVLLYLIFNIFGPFSDYPPVICINISIFFINFLVIFIYCFIFYFAYPLSAARNLLFSFSLPAIFLNSYFSFFIPFLAFFVKLHPGSAFVGWSFSLFYSNPGNFFRPANSIFSYNIPPVFSASPCTTFLSDSGILSFTVLYISVSSA